MVWVTKSDDFIPGFYSRFYSRFTLSLASSGSNGVGLSFLQVRGGGERMLEKERGREGGELRREGRGRRVRARGEGTGEGGDGGEEEGKQEG